MGTIKAREETLSMEKLVGMKSAYIELLLYLFDVDENSKTV